MVPIVQFGLHSKFLFVTQTDVTPHVIRIGYCTQVNYCDHDIIILLFNYSSPHSPSESCTLSKFMTDPFLLAKCTL